MMAEDSGSVTIPVNSDSNFGAMIVSGMAQMTSQVGNIKSDIANLSSAEDQQTQLLYIQYEIGQYNALVEMTSNITKTLNDTIQSVAQKAS